MKINHIKYCIAFLVFVTLQLSTQTLKAQSDTNEIIYEFVDEMPTFKGDYLEFISENTNYPKKAIDNNIQGTAYINVTIGKDGAVKDVQILRNPGGGLGEEAARVVKSMPAWTPGKQNGKAVNVKFTIPVKFVLQGRVKKKTKAGRNKDE